MSNWDSGTKVVLYDTEANYRNLLPLSYTRPVGAFRVGIDTLADKWKAMLPGDYQWLTRPCLREKFPGDTFNIIIGADNWAIFNKWKDASRIVSEYGVIIYPRRGFDIDASTLPENVTYLENAPMIEISSTMIRAGIKENKNMAFFLPPDVYDFILSNSLYK